MSSIGEIIGDLRTDKNVSVELLTKTAGISEATYNRILTGQTDPKLPVFFSLLATLRARTRDILPELDDAYIPFNRAWQHVQQLIPQVLDQHVSVKVLPQEIAKLDAQYAATANAGFAQLSAQLQLVQAQLKQDRPASVKIASDLFATLASYRTWSYFEFAMAAPLMPYLPFTAVTAVLDRATPLNRGEIVQKYPETEDTFDTLLFEMLISVLYGGDHDQIKTVLEAVAKRIIRDRNVFFRTLKQFCTLVITPLLAGDLTQAQAKYDELLNALHFVINQPNNDCYIIFDTLWAAAKPLAKQH